MIRRKRKLIKSLPKKRRQTFSLDKELWLVDSKMIANWRDQNMPDDNLCPILNYKPERWTVDHCHFDLHVRGVISQPANTWEGYIVKYWMKYCEKYTDISLSDALRNMADYLESDYWIKNPLHYKGVEDLRKHLERVKIETLIEKAKREFDIEINPEGKLKEDMIIEYLDAFVKLYEKEEV